MSALPESTVWIVHRDARLRVPLARMAGAGPRAVLGGPADRRFGRAAAPDVVVLGLADDFEQELEFAHAQSGRHPEATWILLAGRDEVGEAQRLFDTLPVEVVPFPAGGPALRRRVRAAAARRHARTLSERRARDAVAGRFARWFADLELPGLLRALDPRLAEVPLLVRGEPGTGRGLLAAYVHAFGGTEGGHLARIACDGLAPDALRAEITAAAADPAAARGLTLCLEEVHRLPLGSQRRLRAWIERGLPEGAPGPPGPVRWIATCDEDGPLDPAESLDLGLAQVLAGLEVRIPPLRERAEAIEPFARQTAAAWCAARGETARGFAPDAVRTLEDHPWPGNLRELEAVVVRSLAAGCGEVVGPHDLLFDLSAPEWPAPVEAREEHPADLGTRPAREADEEALPPAPRQPAPEPAAAPAPREEPAPAAPEPPAPPPEPAALREEIVPPAQEPPAAAPEPRARKPEAPAPAAPEAPAEGAQRAGGERSQKPERPPNGELRRLVGSISHEVRNPLVAIRTFSQLLPERFDDPDFRTRFARIVGDDVRRIEHAVEALTRFAGLGRPETKPVDVSGLLDELLEARREQIQDRRLVVLRELDRERGFARGDAAQLRFAFESLLAKALEMVPERGDVYVASRHHPDALDGRPAVRVLLRFESPDEVAPAVEVEGLSLAETSLEVVLADAVVRAQGGRLSAHTGEGREVVLLIDLPA